MTWGAPWSEPPGGRIEGLPAGLDQWSGSRGGLGADGGLAQGIAAPRRRHLDPRLEHRAGIGLPAVTRRSIGCPGGNDSL